MNSKSLYIAASDQHYKSSAEYKWLTARVIETEQEAQRIELSLFSFLISVVEKIIGTGSANLLLESDSKLYYTKEARFVTLLSMTTPEFRSEKEASICSRAREISWIGFLFNLGYSLYIQGRKIFNRLKKLKSQLKYFLGQCQTHHFLFILFDHTSLRIYSMMISDKGGEDNIDFLSQGRILFNHLNANQNGKETISEFNQGYK